MQTTKYLIVGAGMTGDMAAKGIREHDSDGSITMIGADPHPTYKRPLLTKGLWQGAPEEKLWREPAEDVELVTGCRIVSLDLAAHTATNDAGEEYSWEKLLLATGAKPREIPGAEGVIWFRTLDDYRRLREIAPEGSHVVVIGGGFIGSEIAAGLVGNGARVTMLFPEPGIGFRLFPLGLSQFVADYYREKGVDVRTEELVASASGNRVETESGLTLEADAVVAGLGVIPDTELAESAGLEVDDGIVVDEYGRVPGHEDVFAAGDVARFPVARARHDDAGRARGSREHARQGRRREHGRRRRRRTTTCRSSTPTSSTSATRRSGSSTRGSRWSRTGRSRTARASSRTSRTASRAACCSGTSGTSSTTRAT